MCCSWPFLALLLDDLESMDPDAHTAQLIQHAREVGVVEVVAAENGAALVVSLLDAVQALSEMLCEAAVDPDPEAALRRRVVACHDTSFQPTGGVWHPPGSRTPRGVPANGGCVTPPAGGMLAMWLETGTRPDASSG